MINRCLDRLISHKMDQDLLVEYIQTGNDIELYALQNSNSKLATQKTSLQISPVML